MDIEADDDLFWDVSCRKLSYTELNCGYISVNVLVFYPNTFGQKDNEILLIINKYVTIMTKGRQNRALSLAVHKKITKSSSHMNFFIHRSQVMWKQRYPVNCSQAIDLYVLQIFIIPFQFKTNSDLANKVAQINLITSIKFLPIDY